jgi:Ribbon-helix-helix protein, copG family
VQRHGAYARSTNCNRTLNRTLGHLVAEQQSVNQVNSAHLVHVGAKVEPALAEAVRQLADNGDRSLSREIRRAIAEHVERATDPGALPIPPQRPVVDVGEGGDPAGRRPPSATGEQA